MMSDPILTNEWLAACASQDVQGAPVRVRVLGEPVVLWRGPSGMAAFRDLCIHRGTALSLGRVEDGALVCPYHGWRYAEDGRCTFIPAQPDLSIPTKARAERYHVRERYGLVWVCLGEPAGEPPEFREAEQPGFRTLICGPYDVQAEAPRVIENFLDVSHLMWVHEGYLGDTAHAEIPDYRVHDRGGRLESDTIRIFQPDPDGRGQGVTNHYVYSVLRPLTAHFRKTDATSDDVFAMTLQATPTGHRSTRAYALLARNYALDTPDQTFRDFQNAIFAQDEAILVSQRPEELPLDLAAELHIRSDRLAIAYRRWLGELGVTVGVA
jgi:phenylpropionate dioxygenase-like ring-hydroxylating dioxygenase large terminal subunit